MSLDLKNNTAVERFLEGVLLMEGNATAEACGRAIEKLRHDGYQIIEDVIAFVDGTQRQAYSEEFAALHAQNIQPSNKKLDRPSSSTMFL